jgi:cation transport ATPase
MNGAETTKQVTVARTPDAAARGPRPTQLEVSMNSRYLTNAALAVIGGFTVVASQVWIPATFMWLMFSAAVLAVTLSTAVALRGRGNVQRGLDGLVAILGVWTIVASLVFSGTVVTWLGFASGAAFVALALIGLTLHELYTERVVHSIEVRAANADRELSGLTA